MDGGGGRSSSQSPVRSNDLSFFSSLSPISFLQDPPTSHKSSCSDLFFFGHMVLISPSEHPYTGRSGFVSQDGASPLVLVADPSPFPGIILSDLGGIPDDLSLVRTSTSLKIAKPLDLALAKPYLLWGEQITASGALDPSSLSFEKLVTVSYAGNCQQGHW